VPNPSFEDTVECPHFANQLDKAVGWWASRESPDYFHECDWITGNTAVPKNFCGFQYAYDGSAYAGFVAYYRPVQNQREFFTCQLLSPLIPGKKYIISFKLSLSGEGGRQIPCNKVGSLFSTINYNLNSPAPISNFSQFYTDSIISDTLNWVHVEGSFIADSNYSYMSIGNFFDDAHTDTTYSIPSSMSYYYIDSISLYLEPASSMIENVELDYFHIYPNPVSDWLTIYGNSSIISKVEVLDLNNKLLLEINNSHESRIKISFKNYSESVYILRITFNHHKQHYFKLLKI
jgi:hypothetical protein